MLKNSVFNYLSASPESAVSRRTLVRLTGKDDRAVRKEIQLLKKEYPIVNIGDGYYIASDPDDPQLEQYYRQERAKALHILESIKSHKKLIKQREDDYQIVLDL